MILTYLLLRLLLHILRGVCSISLRRLSSSSLPQVALLLRAGGDGFIADRHSFGSCCGSFASKKEIRPGAVEQSQKSDRKKGQKKGNKVVARCAVCWWWVVVDGEWDACLLPMKFGTGLSQPAP